MHSRVVYLATNHFPNPSFILWNRTNCSEIWIERQCFLFRTFIWNVGKVMIIIFRIIRIKAEIKSGPHQVADTIKLYPNNDYIIHFNYRNKPQIILYDYPCHLWVDGSPKPIACTYNNKTYAQLPDMIFTIQSQTIVVHLAFRVWRFYPSGVWVVIPEGSHHDESWMMVAIFISHKMDTDGKVLVHTQWQN